MTYTKCRYRYCNEIAKSSNFHGEDDSREYLFKCQDPTCGRFFWDRRVKGEFDMKDPASSENQNKEKELCKSLMIPICVKERSVYAIQLRKKSSETIYSVYVGQTGHHPLRRYLQHLRNYKRGRRGKKGMTCLISSESGYTNEEEAEYREKTLSEELNCKYKVYGDGIDRNRPD